MRHIESTLDWRMPLQHVALQMLIKAAAISLFLGLLTYSYAAAYRPSNDAEVIDTLPVGSPTFQSRMGMMSNPFAKQSFSVVEPQIRALMTRAYNQGDPRAIGQAEALLEPYRSDQSPNVMLLRANIFQANHQFDEARLELQAILKKMPNQPDSVLMLSSLNLVQGRFAEARKDCEGIRDIGLMVLRFACLAQVDVMTGKLVSSRDTLNQLSQANNGLTTEQQRWLNLIRADIALRLNDPVLAKSVFEQIDADTAPSLTARADWLLAHRAWAQARQLLLKHKDNDALLLRLVMSELQLKHPDAQAHFKLLSERINVWQERGETAHQREQAMYALMLNPPEKALDLARMNWQKQRETADVIVYTNAAIRARSVSDLKVIDAWIKQTGFEYPRLTQVLTKELAQSITVGK